MEENVEEFVKKRIGECKDIFSQEEYKIVENNQNITRKVYILGALDGYATIK